MTFDKIFGSSIIIPFHHYRWPFTQLKRHAIKLGNVGMFKTPPDVHFTIQSLKYR
jgi:hypothetical protein